VWLIWAGLLDQEKVEARADVFTHAGVADLLFAAHWSNAATIFAI
jgi:hypothetical protein